MINHNVTQKRFVRWHKADRLQYWKVYVEYLVPDFGKHAEVNEMHFFEEGQCISVKTK